MASDIEKVKEKLPIEEVVGWYTDLQRVGGQYKARCPFHNEKTPSFYVSPDRGTYYCFGCGAKGDCISFVQEYERLDFRGALKMLADRAGIQLSHEPHDTVSKDYKTQMYDILERATVFYEKHIADNADVQSYVLKRGLKKETIAQWRIGFAPSGWDSLCSATQKRGVSTQVLLDAGLIKPSEKNQNRYYDRFRSRIMFPLFDISGRTIGFSGRIFGTDDEQEAKYINSPETELFKKSSFLFGLHIAKDVMREKRSAVLVEGQFDLIMAHQTGVTHAVATSGTAMTLEHAKLLKRYADRLILAYDGDAAGQAAIIKAAHLALHGGLEVYVTPLPYGKDPADYALENEAAWKALIEKPTDIIAYTLDVREQKQNETEKGAYLDSVIMPLVATMLSPVTHARYIKMISGRTGLPESKLFEALTIAAKKVPQRLSDQADEAEISPDVQKINVPRRTIILDQFIAGLIWLQKHHEKEFKKYEEKMKQLFKDISPYMYASLEPEAIVRRIMDPKEEVLYLSERLFSGSERVLETMIDLWANFVQEVWREDLTLTMQALKKAEYSQNAAETNDLLQRIKSITERLHNTK